jgi:glycosyltransferase involved in cell wall biosynthesis
MAKIKLFVDCHIFDGNYQGTTTYLKGIYTELIKNNTIHFYFASYDTNKIKKIFGQKDNITYLKYSSKNKFLRLIIEIPKLISKNKIDFAHFQYIVPPIKKCKYIVTIHDVLFLDHPEYFPLSYRIKNKILFYLSAKLSNIVLSVSEYSAQRIKLNFKLNNVSITPNAVDEIYFQKFEKQESQNKVKNKFSIENYFLFVSRWEPRKNHLRLLKVFIEKQYYNEYQIVFVGNQALNNQEFNEYYKEIDELIKLRIKILNNIDFKDLVEITRGAKLSIYPSLAEGFGIPPLESIACNVPTICSNTTSMQDFDFLKEFMFNPEDEEDISKKIEKALVEIDFKKIKDQLRNKYSWEKSAEVFYNALLNQK